ncbi:MAG: hypothetical protein K2P65_06380 [Lachnospiraceae bacterium]|nr:hypothetical protein [Lachnospiraceae bacterium]
MVIAMKMSPQVGCPAAVKKISVKEAFGWLFVIAGLVMLGNSLRLCLSRDIWYDELFTMGMIEHSYGELIHFTAKDVHPPLYYCIAKAIVDLCKLIVPSADAVMITKMVSVMPYFLLVFYALTYLRTRFGIFVAGLFTFCIVSMPQMSAYTVEMRMYSFALFFVTAAFFHAYGILYDRECEGEDTHYRQKHYAALAFYGLAAAYTQYFACVAVIMVYLYLLVCLLWRYWRAKRQHMPVSMGILKGWLACVLVSVVGYVPWLFVLLSQIRSVRTNYWILPLTWRSIGGCVKFLMKPAFANEGVNVILAVVLFLLYVGLLVRYGYRVYRCCKACVGQASYDGNGSRQFSYAFAGCMVLCGLVCFGFLASVLIRPIFVYRYMLPAMGCFWLCFALCLDALSTGQSLSQPTRMTVDENMSGNKMQTTIPELIMRAFFWASVCLVSVVGFRDYRAFMGEEEYKIVLMKETEKAISDIAKDDIILYNFDQLQAVEGYYRDQETYLWGGEPEALIVEMFGNKASVESVSRIKDWLSAGKKVWFFGSFNSRDDICKEWETEGIHAVETGSYLLERYWFNIYAVSLDSQCPSLAEG